MWHKIKMKKKKLVLYTEAQQCTECNVSLLPTNVVVFPEKLEKMYVEKILKAEGRVIKSEVQLLQCPKCYKQYYEEPTT